MHKWRSFRKTIEEKRTFTRKNDMLGAQHQRIHIIMNRIRQNIDSMPYPFQQALTYFSKSCLEKPKESTSAVVVMLLFSTSDFMISGLILPTHISPQMLTFI